MEKKKIYKAPIIKSEKIQVGVFGDYSAVEGLTKFLVHPVKDLCTS